MKNAFSPYPHLSGGVVLISHNREFTEHLCPERWVVEHGRLSREGDVAEDEKIEVDCVVCRVEQWRGPRASRESNRTLRRFS